MNEIVKIFSKYKLKLDIEVNKRVVNFLDLTLDLQTGMYTPFMKENNNILYINKKSNHPPSILKNIPENINNRLTRNSANQNIFNSKIQPYQDALNSSGYSSNLKFDPSVKQQQLQPQQQQRRKRSRKITWFNPPFSLNVKSNIGKIFLKIVDECLQQNLNQNLSNKKLAERGVTLCNCRDKANCPMPDKCINSNLVYRYSVTRTDTGNVETYTGCTVNFKERHGTHMRTITNLNMNTTTLTSYIRSLNSNNTPYTITWGAKEHTAPYNPATGWCRLCTLERHHILFDRVNASLNQRSEFFSPCYHKKRNLLVNR